MKQVKDRIKDSQDFYNGLGLGFVVGAFAMLFLISQGNIVPIIEKKG